MGRSSLACILLLLACNACSGSRPVGRAADEPPIEVTVATTHEMPLAVVYRASGTVKGRNTAVLTSKTTGYVREIRVRSGDRITAGQTLVELEANEVRSEVARARAGLDHSMEAKAEAENALQAAQVAEKVAKTTFDRVGTLLKDGAIPQQVYDDAEAHWQGAVAQERMAQARLRAMSSSIEESKASLGEARATLAYAQIAAPFNGRVLERRVDPGVLASPGTPLLVVSDEGTPWVEAAVDESRADRVKIGDEASLELDVNAPPVAGRVSEIVPTVDITSRAFLVKVDLPGEAGAVRPGTFVRVGLPMGVRDRLVVPTTAISPFGGLDRIFVVEGARARLRMITSGETQGAWTEVPSGLSPGETIVTSPPSGLHDGSRVQARP